MPGIPLQLLFSGSQSACSFLKVLIKMLCILSCEKATDIYSLSYFMVPERPLVKILLLVSTCKCTESIHMFKYTHIHSVQHEIFRSTNGLRALRFPFWLAVPLISCLTKFNSERHHFTSSRRSDFNSALHTASHQDQVRTRICSSELSSMTVSFLRVTFGSCYHCLLLFAVKVQERYRHFAVNRRWYAVFS